MSFRRRRARKIRVKRSMFRSAMRKLARARRRRRYRVSRGGIRL